MSERPQSDPGSPDPHVLREYSLVADGERGGLIGPKGELVWMCVPRWDGEAVFSSLIGGGGFYTLAPTDPWFVWGGYYEDGTLIWRSRFVTSDRVVECREALALPADEHRAVVLRRVVALDKDAEMTVRLDPRAAFGRYGMRDIRRRDGRLEARSGGLRIRWSGAEEARQLRSSSALEAEIIVEEGRHADLVLEISDRPLPEEPPDPDTMWESTAQAWSQVAPDCSDTAAPRDSRHAYAVLRGLTSSSGAMVAAATMSLPERAEAGRNYDYRYAWIRDQCYSGLAVASQGPHRLLDDAVRFVAERLLDDGDQLKPAYAVDGSAVPDEEQLKQLRGYPGGQDRRGNWVNRQFQLDAFGESLELFAAARRCDALSDEGLRAAAVAVAAIERRFEEPDAGLWELDPAWWAQSRLECVAGLRQAARCEVAGDRGVGARWESLADAILAETSRRCTHASGRWQRASDDERVDASLVLPPVRGALDPGDGRTLATLAAVHDDLVQDGFAYRFRHDERPLGSAEGAFLLCGFMLSLALLAEGRREPAARWFERNRSACGPPGLLSEEYDVEQRQMRGNLPQAFVHALMLECAIRLGPEGGEDNGRGHGGQGGQSQGGQTRGGRDGAG